MKYIVSYLKPFAIGIVFTFTLLSIQVFCDLSLPNYMSDIVDIGISQNGIESSAPEVLSEEAYEFATIFMSEEEIQLLSKSYSLVNGADYQDDYPLAGEYIYVRNDSADVEQTSEAFSYILFTMLGCLEEMGVANVSTSSITSELNMEELYQIGSFISMIDTSIVMNAREVALEYDPIITSQAGILFVSAIYDELGVSSSEMQTAYIVETGTYMLLFALAGGVATILVNFINSKISAGVARNLRKKVFAKVNSFSNEEYDKFSTSSLITRSTNDITQIQNMLMMALRFLIYSPLMVVGGVIMALRSSSSMAWIIALACVVLISMIVVIAIVVLPKFKVIQKLVDKINLVARETLNGLMVIKAFRTEKVEKDRFDLANKDFARTNLFVNRAMAFMTPIMTFIMNGTTVLIVWIGSNEVANSTMQVGDMMAYIQYTMQIMMSFFMLSMMFIFLPRALVSAGRINEILTTEALIKDPEEAKLPSETRKGDVEFKNVSFKFHGADENSLENISFTAKKGETIAFIGPTGAGKSTLLNLIPRFYDVQSGEILIDGVNVQDMSQHMLHSKIGYIPQKSILMSGTIGENIRFGNKNASDEEVLNAATIAQAADFIGEKEEGFNSYISQGGSNVSGGQRQRLSIARALAVGAEFYLFDDSFSALDYATDARLRAALKEKISDATVLIVAQRVSTILNADRIYVMEDGKIIGSGTHKELIKSCPEYLEIASTQLSKEELENE